MTAAMACPITLKPLGTKALQRLAIERQVAEYLARGGTVATIDHTDNHCHDQPVRRSRREQVDHMKRFGADRRRG